MNPTLAVDNDTERRERAWRDLMRAANAMHAELNTQRAALEAENERLREALAAAEAEDSRELQTTNEALRMCKAQREALQLVRFTDADRDELEAAARYLEAAPVENYGATDEGAAMIRRVLERHKATP